jgi:hypothetical protein
MAMGWCRIMFMLLVWLTCSVPPRAACNHNKQAASYFSLFLHTC